MAQFTKESLENLRARIDLTEVIGSHVSLKKQGASYKGLCPFHDEKSPSFVVHKGDSHYHCFGCGAHGDAIAFLMNHQKMSFMDAVTSLAEHFHVHLQQTEEQEKGPNKAHLKEALEAASRFYHFMLLHSEEGHNALHYLYNRGLDLAFIQQFQIGLAPKSSFTFRKTLHALKFSDDTMLEAGLLSQTKSGDYRDFFSDRITFPVRDARGAVIGFSARKYKEDTFGGKYINTPETPLFKKSYVLFGLNYSRVRIAKERRAIIVEGQIDALRLIQEGFNYTVAGQGTAFGEGHVKELLHLGVNCVYLALDADLAGLEAAVKIGDFFQREGVEVYVIRLPMGADPDSILREEGATGFHQLMEKKIDYLSFLIEHLSVHLNLESPAAKAELVQTIAKRIRNWTNPLMVHESLRKLAKLLQVPESSLGVGLDEVPKFYVKKGGSAGLLSVDPNRILEMDLLRALLLLEEDNDSLLKILKFINKEHFHVDACLKLFVTIARCIENKAPRDLLSIAIALDDEEAQVLMSEILEKKVNKEKIKENLVASIQKVLEREWMLKREEIRMQINSGKFSETEVLDLAKQFDQLKKNPPSVVL